MCKKVGKTKPSSFTQKSHQFIFVALFNTNMSQISHRKIFDDICIGDTKFAQNYSRRMKKSWSRARWTTVFCRMRIKITSKKLKIALLNGLMVKLRFKCWKLHFANICGPVLGRNIWRNSTLNSTGKSKFWPPKIYLEYLDADITRDKNKISNWNIWMGIKWEANLRNPYFPLSMDLNP